MSPDGKTREASRTWKRLSMFSKFLSIWRAVTLNFKEIPLEYAEEIEAEVDDEVDVLYYVERKNNLLYEVQFFDEFVLTRPATPAFSGVINRLSMGQFYKEYEPFQGNSKQIDDIILGYDFIWHKN